MESEVFDVTLSASSVKHKVESHTSLLQLQEAKQVGVFKDHSPYVIGQCPLHVCLSWLQRLKYIMGEFTLEGDYPQLLFNGVRGLNDTEHVGVLQNNVFLLFLNLLQ